jgi:hypothetical protein
MRKIMMIAAMLLWGGVAVAQHSHGNMKGPNGGPMQDVAGVHAELVLSGNVVTINTFDEGNKPVSSKGFSGQALITSGGGRETVQLAPAGENSLKGETKNPVPSGATVTLVLKNAAGKSGQVKF